MTTGMSIARVKRCGSICKHADCLLDGYLVVKTLSSSTDNLVNGAGSILAVIEFHISCACFCKVMLNGWRFVLLCNSIEVIWSALLEFVINLVALFWTRCMLLF